MPNVYTEQLYRGNPQSLKDYLLRIAEDTIGSIKRDYNTLEFIVVDHRGDYYEKAVEQAEAQYERAIKLTLIEAEEQVRQAHESYNKQVLSSGKLIDERRQRYQEKLDELEAWNPSTVELLKIKDDGIDALKHSLAYDCISYPPAQPDDYTPAQYLKEEISSAENLLTEARRRNDNHKVNMKRRQRTLDELIQSFPQEAMQHG